jgi:putative flippase GtrA
VNTPLQPKSSDGRSAEMDQPPVLEPQAQRIVAGTSAREFVRFVFFGGVNTLLSYSIYVLLLFVVSYPVAYTVSFVAGMFISYCLQARFVFHERLRLSRALQYPVVYMVQYVIGLVLMYLLVDVAEVSKYLAPFFVVMLTLPVTYRLSRYVIKRGGNAGRESPP